MKPEINVIDLPHHLMREVDRVHHRMAVTHLAETEMVILTQKLAQQLADVAAAGQGRPVRVVPKLPVYALAHQLSVMVRDVISDADAVGQQQALSFLVSARRMW
ncbi:MAG: hypothetical protein ACRCTR_03380 [Actinomycetota bacterium]